MKFRAEINVMPHKALLDPQGKAVSLSMPSIGKHITLEVEAASKDEAQEKVTLACQKLLANPVMESFDFELLNQA